MLSFDVLFVFFLAFWIDGLIFYFLDISIDTKFLLVIASFGSTDSDIILCCHCYFLENMKSQLVNSMSFGYNWVNEHFYTLILSFIYIFSTSLLENANILIYWGFVSFSLCFPVFWKVSLFEIKCLFHQKPEFSISIRAILLIIWCS